MQVEWETIQAYMSHHPRWFEDFGRRAPSHEHLAEYRAAVPGSWKVGRRGYWILALPPEVPPVAQGWKLHVSATSRDSTRVLRAALPVLRDAGVHFKFLMDPAAVLECNGKSFGRGSSGKFITVYPADEADFRAVGDALTRALDGFEGPYLLSDRRYPGSRAVFYRYGGFATVSRLHPDGIPELLIHAPDGTPVPDTRNAYFHLPPWVRDPFTGERHPDEPAAADEETAATTAAPDTAADPHAAPDPGKDPEDAPEAGQFTLDGGRFTITSAMAFTNRGGIYRGIDNESGADVVIREARPGVEIGAAAVDAVELLRHEYAMLTELADTGLFVRPVALFTEWEHAFLVEEFVEGTHLGHLSIGDNPVYTLDLTAERLTDYYERFRALWLQVADAIAACHARGIVLGDLSPTNIMVTPDDRIRVIDLESAHHEDAPPGPARGAGLATPGMAPRRTRRTGGGDRRADYYALGGLMLVTVMLCHQPDVIDPAVPRRLFAEAAEDLALPAELVALIGELYDEEAALPDPAALRARIAAVPFARHWRQAPPLAAPALPEQAASARLHKRVDAVLDGIAEYLLNTADTTRDDRLYPADPMVFLTNPLSLAHGAYGTLYALRLLTGEVPPAHLGWALRRPVDRGAVPPGLYHGAAGVAWAQSALGLPEAAARTLRDLDGHPALHEEAGVATGAAGYGMACLRLWRDTGDSGFLARAADTAAHLADLARSEGGTAWWEHPSGTTPVGYAEGASGVAMFLLALHTATGDTAPLQLGRAALDFDLAQAEYQPGGTFSFPAVVATDGRPSAVLRHYWDHGTAGVLTTLLRYHQVTGDGALREQITRLLPDVRRKYTVFPQLFHGTSGLGNALLDAYEFLGAPELLGDAERVASAVLCHAIERPEGTVFAGEQTVRETCDLASGSAGVALFLRRLRRAAPGARTNANFLLDDVVGDGRAARTAGTGPDGGAR
ncbi:lanthionine synthetase LanC family protein [Streptomyces sp. NPDC050560]|uniref:class III lanthionine synthetase LanKC N-terminal domain-containing protein n=1 Tax=Streptomyces sp. NPDC050560 TaxID=3365630 RepID=UPI0037895D41